jgi:hypothetical protein
LLGLKVVTNFTEIIMDNIDYLTLPVSQLRHDLTEAGCVVPRGARKRLLTALYEKNILRGPLRATSTSSRPSRSGRANLRQCAPNRTNIVVCAETSADPPAPAELTTAPIFRAAADAAADSSTTTDANTIAQAHVNPSPAGDVNTTLRSVLIELQALKSTVGQFSNVNNGNGALAANVNTPAAAPPTGNMSNVTTSGSGLTTTKNPDEIALNDLLICAPVSSTSLSTSSTTASTTTLSSVSASATATHMTQGYFGVAPDSVPDIEPVPPVLRQRIISGKDTNLAMLLSPDPICERVVETDGDSYILRPASDPRSTKSLTMLEFMSAFTKYTNVMTEVYPYRLPELTRYMSNIVNMSFRFGGNFFYEYHKLFSRKAACHLERGVKLDWSQVDMSIHRVVFGGCKANVCQLCNSLDHGTKFCPKQISASKSQYNPNKQNFKGQSDNKPFKRTLHNGVEVCFNFNGRNGCVRNECRFHHVCLMCKGNHSQRACNSKSDIKGENSDVKQ